MKKYVSILVILVLLSFCLSFSVYAETPSFSLSEDYRTLYWNGNSYSWVDSSTLSMGFNEIYRAEPQLSAAQQEAIKDATFYANEDYTVIKADIYFRSGATLSVSFLQDDCRDTYEHLLNDASTECTIDFYWPDNNTVIVKASELLGEAVVLEGLPLSQGDSFEITAQSGDEALKICKGALIVYNDEYYYVDYQENNVVDPQLFTTWTYSSLNAYQITEPALLEALGEAVAAYYGDSFGFLLDESFTGAISLAFLVLLFAVIPLGVAVTALIFTIRSKGYYRLIWGTTIAVSAVGLAAFAILCILLVIFL